MLALGEELLARGISVSMPALADDPHVASLALSRGDFSIDQVERPNIVIVDDYDVQSDVERRWMASGAFVVVVDDAPTRQHECHLLVDQNDLFKRQEDAYRSRVTASTRLLLGPQFAMLGRSIQRARALQQRRSAIRRVVVNWGAVDQPELTALVERVMASRGLELRVIASRDRVSDMAEHWLWADLAVGAAGSSSWERACVGLPSVVIAVAGNQDVVGQTLSAAGLAAYVGTMSSVTEAAVTESIAELLVPDRAAEMAARCTAAVDGRGAARVARAIHAQVRNLSMRVVQPRDTIMLRAWRNDPESVRQSLSHCAVAESEHAEWMRHYLSAGGRSLLLIAEMGDRPVGFVRFDDVADGWRLSYGVAPECRGRGLAAPMVDAGLDELVRQGPTRSITVHVREDNVRSLRALGRCGFVTEERCDGFETLRTLA
jgi:spore coat polysaccharide biosynthesis predicted glycosyltransferase SpsG/RimJ/RimL family protein N-acetyltransferase